MNNRIWVWEGQISDLLPHLQVQHLRSSAVSDEQELPDFHPHQPTSLSLALGWTKPLAGPDWAVGKSGKSPGGWENELFRRPQQVLALQILQQLPLGQEEEWQEMSLGVKEHIFFIKTAGCWCGLPREFVLSPSLVSFSLSCLYPWWFSRPSCKKVSELALLWA